MYSPLLMYRLIKYLAFYFFQTCLHSVVRIVAHQLIKVCQSSIRLIDQKFLFDKCSLQRLRIQIISYGDFIFLYYINMNDGVLSDSKNV
jgi:hypothetical protein